MHGELLTNPWQTTGKGYLKCTTIKKTKMEKPARKKQPEELLLTNYTRPILSLLEQKDVDSVNVALSTFREKGVVRYERTLAIPMESRIPELAKTPEGRMKVSI